MKVVVTGGTGFVGRALVRALLNRGDTVVALTRDPFGAAERLSWPGQASPPGELQVKAWDPGEGGPWQGHLDGADAVVHLAGENIGGTRLGAGLVARARSSRIRGAELLVEGMQIARSRPRVFVSASGVGYYGTDRQEEVLDEGAGPGTDTLARLCVDWEAAASKARELGVRVVCARLGLVVDEDARSLSLMALPFRFFVGGPMGSGDQYVAWIHRADVVNILLRCLDDEALRGPVNVTAPEPVTNEQFSIALGQSLSRPSWLPVPALALRLVFGEGAELVLGGQRAVPRKLLDAGYEWHYGRVRQALQACVAKSS